ncbi:MAG: NUDIX hydrolase [Sphingobium sp.]
MTGEDEQLFRRAATLIILRHRVDSAPDILMAERAGSMAFAGGALVFPGGAVDAADEELARSIVGQQDEEDAAARVAAIRETLEEAGLAVGFDRPCDPAMTQKMRNALLMGISFGDMLKDFGVAINPDQLKPFARWFPQHRMRRVFDTRFYITDIRDDAAHISPDMSETQRVFWAKAKEVLAMVDKGHAKIIFPTRRNLERIAQFTNVAEAYRHVTQYPAITISPWQEMRDGVEHLCIPEAAGYPVTSEPMTEVLRG